MKNRKSAHEEGTSLKLKTAPINTVYGLLEREHKTTFHKLNQLYEVLRKLRYEGKLKLGKNIAEINEIVDYFKQELDGHMRDEEKILFPFLQKHIPRLEPMIYLLLSEHEDFRNSIGNLKAALYRARAGASVKPNLIDEIGSQGTYLICLLRSHMWAESHSLYKVADKELRLSEKRKLIKQIHVKGR